MNAAPKIAQTLTIGPFFQDVATILTHLEGLPARKVHSVACATGGTLYAGTENGLIRYDSGLWKIVSQAPHSPVRWMRAGREGSLYVVAMQESYQMRADGTVETLAQAPKDSIGLIPGLSLSQLEENEDAESLLFLTPHTLHDGISGKSVTLPEGVTARAFAQESPDSLLVATDIGLFRFNGREWRVVPSESPRANHPGRLLSPDIRDILADGNGGFWLATAQGLNYYTQDFSLEFTGMQGLPILDTRRLARDAEGALWIATGRGVIRLLDGQFRYYAGRRWLPDDNALDLAADNDDRVWIVTESGLAQIASIPMTFSEKAEHCERITAARHDREGFVTDCILETPGDLDSFLPHASDNDGLWTALYIAAESFRYAVTQSPEARQKAQKSMRALLELVRVTGIPGFPARTYIRKGERVHQSDPGPNWYPSPVEPDILYKNDTSSDEIDGHVFAWFIYSELVADAEEKARIAETCRAVTNHILDHNYTLVGPTGKHTRWGVWTPESLNDDPNWAEERGLNSLEILAALKVAIHLCGDERFQTAYRNLIEKHGYALNTVNQKRLPPEGENNHSDDELAALAYYSLLLLEDDPQLRALYLLSLERTWHILRPEGSPFHNMIYGACSGKPCDAERAAQWLRDAPLDLRRWTMTNSHRADVVFNTEIDRFEKPQLTHALPPGEQSAAKWNHNPYLPDGGNNGAVEEDGTFWLLPYWMGRYHGILTE